MRHLRRGMLVVLRGLFVGSDERSRSAPDGKGTRMACWSLNEGE